LFQIIYHLHSKFYEKKCHWPHILQLYPELKTFVDIDNLPKVDPNWLVGFVDGEGSFYISITSSNSTKVKSRVELCFFIKQAKESASSLFAIQNFFGKGKAQQSWAVIKII
jgi:LAGLIDADG endonuclease